jgi:hypothetical protein
MHRHRGRTEASTTQRAPGICRRWAAAGEHHGIPDIEPSKRNETEEQLPERRPRVFRHTLALSVTCHTAIAALLVRPGTLRHNHGGNLS